jgi:hypothetical protein
MLSRWEAFLNEQERKGALVRATRRISTIREDVKKLTPLPRVKDVPSLHEILDETRADPYE